MTQERQRQEPMEWTQTQVCIVGSTGKPTYTVYNSKEFEVNFILYGVQVVTEEYILLYPWQQVISVRRERRRRHAGAQDRTERADQAAGPQE